MEVAVVRPSGASMANAIAEGMVKAENEELKHVIDMLLHEIAEKDELIAMYRWKEQRAREQSLERLKEGAARRRLAARGIGNSGRVAATRSGAADMAEKKRVPVWQRVCAVLGLI